MRLFIYCLLLASVSSAAEYNDFQHRHFRSSPLQLTGPIPYWVYGWAESPQASHTAYIEFQGVGSHSYRELVIFIYRNSWTKGTMDMAPLANYTPGSWPNVSTYTFENTLFEDLVEASGRSPDRMDLYGPVPYVAYDISDLSGSNFLFGLKGFVGTDLRIADAKILDYEFVPDYCVGDANLDGVFNSVDLVLISQAGKYEQNVFADWTHGDWNGDNRFNSSDLVEAFIKACYSEGNAILAEDLETYFD